VSDKRIVAPLLKRAVDVLAAIVKNIINNRVRFNRGQR
jgi:hypothetical protein